MKKEIKAGQQYNRLTTVEPRSNRKWLCRCVCGNERVVYGYDLLRDHTKSCGCLRNKAKAKPYIKPYVYTNLAKYGNTVLSNKVYDYLGEENILKALEDKGFKCYIEIIKYEEPYRDDKLNDWSEHTSIIVRVKDDETI